MFPKVKLYALSTCIHCRKAKQYLEDQHVSYDCVYVDMLAGQERTDAIDAVKKLNPALSFPTMQIGDKVVVGFDQDEMKAALEQ